MSEAQCVFCRIVARQSAATLLYESEDVVAFPDVNPSAPVHILVVPKQHIPTFLDIAPGDSLVFMHMVAAVQQLVRERDLARTSYRLIFNGGSLQHVPHLHWHIVSRSGRR